MFPPAASCDLLLFGAPSAFSDSQLEACATELAGRGDPKGQAPCWPVGGEILGAPLCAQRPLPPSWEQDPGLRVSAGGGADPWLPQSWGQGQVCRGSAHVLGEGAAQGQCQRPGEKRHSRPYLLGWAVWRDSGVPLHRGCRVDLGPQAGSFCICGTRGRGVLGAGCGQRR